jgi:hypothetical protein
MLPVERHGQSTSWCGTPEGQSPGGPWGDAVLHAPRWRPYAKGASSSGRPDAGHLRLVSAAEGMPAAFLSCA